MDRMEEAKQWLNYHERGIKPSRFKSIVTIYSDQSFDKKLDFNFENCSIKLTPYKASGLEVTAGYKYMPSFVCEVTSELESSEVNVSAILKEIFTWLEFDVEIGSLLDTWEEYEGNWIKCFNGTASTYSQNRFQEIPKKGFEEFLCVLARAKCTNSKRAKKISAISRYLQEGLKLKFISPNYSFLSFYKVVEIISDDLASKGYCSTESSVARELVSFKLLSRGSQRAKIYYLLSAIDNDFTLEDMVYLADVRNELAHNDHQVSFDKLIKCQSLAYWCAEHFVSIVDGEKQA
ncbi:TPA: hypothetical protein NG675_004597 [Vibrio parahaemolyticus]|nr:hypothetical protein [Vibrio parahaemolyticus]HCE2818519.1 hypothetical protein [Vibrio parahaemolyticus]HCG5307150.1 hypothetical protein [Vibrio parahaemolyticus]HCG7534267.1 hypothetical protein [Vibrio parahaemolyticus]HCG8238797.1 hypothetical protein [Vibrio parahaemolyticus]